MKFLNFLQDDAPRLGLLLPDDQVLDLTRHWPTQPAPTSIDALIGLGMHGLDTVRAILDTADRPPAGTLALSATTLLAPVRADGRNIFNVGRNYREHIREGNIANGRPVNAFPPAIEFFTKPRTALVGPGGSILRHAALTEALDYEVELAIIIGKGGRDIAVDQAKDHIFGYTILNDVTARDLQKLHGQWFKGKGLDGTCPLGPVIVHASAVADPDALWLELDVDGELRQRDNTQSMIFDVATIVSQLSAGLTLLPGDVIATGTPQGVGYAMRPPRCLQVGQVVRARIEGIGELVNTVTD